MSTQKRALPSSSSGQPSQPKRPCFALIGEESNGWSLLTKEDFQAMIREELQRAKSDVTEDCHREESNGWSMLTKEDFQAMIREELQRAKSDVAKDCHRGESNGWSMLTKEDFQATIREEMQRAAKDFHSFVRNAFEEIIQKMQSTENASKKLKEAVEPANIHSFHLGRANAKSTAKNDTKNLQLQVQTQLSLPLFTGKKLEGEGGARICVALIDANSRGIFRSDPESSIKLDVVVLEGDFNKDNEENWTHEEFKNYRVKEREGKGPLLTGILQVTLKEGVGKLGELTFTDNSSWNRSKSFRLGLMVASGYCGNTRIQEGITDAFRVKENRGESNMKHFPPASGDEVWRLEKIGNGGKSHQKLRKAGIHIVGDFLLQLFTDPQKLREILGKSITAKNWNTLVDHAKTCKTNWKLYLYHSDGMRKEGVVFNTDGQLIGLIKDSESFATHRLSAQEKEDGYAIMKKALHDWKYVKEFGGETFSDSMQKSCAYSSQVFDEQMENSNPIQRNLAPSAPVGPEAPLANVASTAEGTNGPMALALPEQSQSTNSGNSMEISLDENFCLAAHQPMSADHFNVLTPSGYHGSTTAGLLTQSHGINLQNAMRGPMIDSSSQMDYTVCADVLPSEPSYALISNSPLPQGNRVMEDLPSIEFDNTLKEFLAELFDNGVVRGSSGGVKEDLPSIELDNAWKERLSHCSDYGAVRGSSRGVIGWLKIKAVLQWGYFIRKRGVRLVPLDKPPIEVQACS